MHIAPMSPEMRERVNDAIRWRAAQTTELTADYVDQAQVCEVIAWGGGFKDLFASYTPWGIAHIEAAFLDRMQIATTWDSKDLIRRDILSNPHLCLNIKDRLLQAFEKADWARWHDSYFAKLIQGESRPANLQARIQESPYLDPAARDNLLLNLRLIQEGEP